MASLTLTTCGGVRVDGVLSTRSERPQHRKRDHPLPSFLETTRVDGVKAPQHRGTPDSDEDSFSNSEPSFDWPSSYFGADARLARLGREAMVLGPARGTLRRSARRGSACDETWDCADRARALGRAAKPRGRSQRCYGTCGRVSRQIRAAAAGWETRERAEGVSFSLEYGERVYPAKARERALSRF